MNSRSVKSLKLFLVLITQANYIIFTTMTETLGYTVSGL